MRVFTKIRKAGLLESLMRRSLPRRAVFLCALLAFWSCLGPALGQTVSIPDTPAGKVLQAWLDAFNSGDRAKIDAYINTFDPQQSADMLFSFRNQTGGFDLISIERSEPKLIKFA